MMDRTDIPNLSTPAGRRAYQEYYHELLVDGRGRLVPSFWRLWRAATFGTELHLPAPTDIQYRIGHTLGLRAGTRLFMEEVIVRHYFNNVQALVYLGATILLVFLGLRFAGVLTETVALIGIGIEAFMLLVLFMVLFYTPEEDVVQATDHEAGNSGQYGQDREVISEVLEEIEQIGSSYASLGLKLENATIMQEQHLKELTERIGKIEGLNHLNDHTEQLQTTNQLLQQLTERIDAMNKRIDMLFGREVEYHVRHELENIMQRGLNNTNGTVSTPKEQQQQEPSRE